MIITTTDSIAGHNIIEYHGLVFGEVIAGVNKLKDVTANFHNKFGGRAGSYEKSLQKARDGAITEMEKKAQKLGANAIIGVDIDYEMLGEDNGMMMVSASGTAITIE